MEISEIATDAMIDIWNKWCLYETWEEQHHEEVQNSIATIIQSAIDLATRERLDMLVSASTLLKEGLAYIEKLENEVSRLKTNRPDDEHQGGTNNSEVEPPNQQKDEA